MIPAITALMRPHCRIPLGEPDETGSNWRTLAPLVVPESSLYADYVNAKLSPPKTEIRAMANDDTLFVRFDCALEDVTRLTPKPGSLPLAELERAWVQLYPHNDPVVRYRFEADFKGATSLTRHHRINGERSLGNVPDMWQASAPVSVEWDIRHGFDSKAWWVEMEIPWEAIGLRHRPAVIGFECGRPYKTGHPGCPMDDISWPAAMRESSIGVNLEPGEALIGPDAGSPERLELSPPRFGTNRGRLILGNAWPKKPAQLRVCTESDNGSRIAENTYAVASETEFEYPLDRLLCSHLDVFKAQRLVLELHAADGSLLYTARLPFDRHLGICVDEPYGETFRSRALQRGLEEKSEDRAEALDYKHHSTCDQWLDRVCRALPRLERRNTTQGAPSDFCLTDPNGRLVVNLMADGAWERLAAIIEERFQTTEDRLVAAMAFIGQKSVTNLFLCHLFFDANMERTYKHGNMHDKMGPLSILRYGGGPAVARAVVLARLLQQVRDPKTGKPFVTRVLSLDKEGGPRLATRHDPFWQTAGPVGVVAVEYRHHMTLLDPTTLAFFVKGVGKLATISEMLADERVLNEGTGRSAALFRKIDFAEVAHEQPNRRFSKGVFPELCPDEDRPDRPFDPRERQVLRTITAKEGKQSKPLEGFLDAFEQPGRRGAAVSVCWDRKACRVRVVVKGVAPQRLKPLDREREEVHLALDTVHGHTSFDHFMVTLAGARKLWRDSVSNIQTLCKHLSTEQSTGSAEINDVLWKAAIKNQRNGYVAEFEIPWEALRLRELPPVIGLNVWVQGRAPQYEQVFLCPPRWHIAPDPFHFADLYLVETAVTISEIDLGIPTWGENTGRAVLSNRSNREVTVTLQAHDHLAKRRWVTHCAAVTVSVAARGTRALEFPYTLNPEEKMGNPQRIVLRARHDGGEFFCATWFADYCGPVSVYHRYGSAVKNAPKPKAGDSDFPNKKIAYICSRIPQFKRLTTRDGAASDFVLRSEDDSVEFNLMRPGVLEKICDYLADQFDNDLDRILGVFYFSHAPFFARHMSWGHRIMEGADPLSVIRGNFAGAGGNCGYHSRVFGGLACHLKLAGKHLGAHGSVPVHGHVISAVSRRGSKALLDADVGHIFLTRDGSDLATLEEMRANKDLLTTAGAGDLARYYTVDDAAVRIRKTMLGQPWKGSFPPGAPQQ
jgi:hypothetical protein